MHRPQSRRLPRLALGCALLSALAASPAPGQQLFDMLPREHVPLCRGGFGLAVGDFDGDGRRDVLVVGQVRDLLLATAPNRFRFASDRWPRRGGLYDRQVAVGDLDGDGDPDVVLARAFRPDEVYRNDGAAGLIDVTATALPGPLYDDTRAVALGDVDGDGDLDAVFGSATTTDRLLFNDGAGRFTADPQRGLSQLGGTTVTLLRDFDGDGDLDLLRLSDGTGGGAPQIDLNSGTGVFTPLLDGVATQDRNQLGGIATDVDGDGDLDVLVRTPAPGLRRFVNDGRGRFTDLPAGMPLDLPVVTDLVAFDRDGDGDDDLLLTSESGTRLLRNDAGTFVDFPGVTVPDPQGRGYVAAVLDVDGDGDQDAFVIGGALALWIDEGGRFVDALDLQLGAIRGASVVGDLDGDGDLDVVTEPVTSRGLGPRVFVNAGDGTFTEQLRFPAAAAADESSLYGLALADLDGDGDLDVLLAQSTRPVRVYVNDGAGRFAAAPAAMPNRVEPVGSLDVADVDGDGDVDVALGVFANNSPALACRLLLNDGRGVFTDAPGGSIPVLSALVQDVAFADVDGDSDADLLFEEQSRIAGTTVHLWRNDGRGGFVAVPGAFPPAPGYPGGIAVGDADGDGDVDVVSGFALFANDGAGTFTDVTAQRCSRAPGVGAVLVDADGDGDADLLSYQAALLQDASGRFVEVPDLFGSTPARPYAVGDVDRDGDLDVIGSYALYRSLQRHLSMPLLPQVGGLARFRVDAATAAQPQVAIVWIAAARLPAPQRVPGFGWFGLDVTQLVDSVPLLVPAGAPGRLAVSVPNVASLAGAVVHAQALLLGAGGPADWRLTGTVSAPLVR
ncbi:MAG: VCBS repeat-containing protein [Planctomycetes bacterium]|nr:VCBS repeat-containing protein [Planctomycetota bacterium]